MGSPTYDYSDETVIVTGGSSGIGRAIATRYGAAGATVIVADVRENPKDVGETIPTHERIIEQGGEAEFVETDVSDPDEIESVVAAAHEFGGVDVMVNNAGLFVEGDFVDVSPEDFDRIFAVNTKGVFFGTQAAASDMLERGEPGNILNTASISSNVAQHGQVQYDATKGAVRMITRGTALELAEHGIRVNAVAPGQIATEFVDGLAEQMKEDARTGGFLKPIPLGRPGYPEDIAGAALFLTSEAAGYVTGELLHVDGGWQIC
ncbi:SDR family NAD(P)-dependent oxidoreductase [Haladaptatus caseinilyticus]|uniref:SDR family NAD(P)-dependent oxidoreductase n=1 Tax=Haladaptatus caseinilyticus TaxID=2993314 RepID=UPI00224B4A20|nr:SDR family oxidoreductase [Haladaptatus caseinilyticus]